MPKRVLVLDFDHKTRKSTVALLQRRGIDVVEAGSMDEFTRALIPGAPDVAIVEPELPGADSSELCSLIHGSSIGSPEIILASHSLGTDALRFRASQIGAKLYFERPIADTALVQAIADAVAKANSVPSQTSPKVAPAKMPGSGRPEMAPQRTAAAPNQVELTKIQNSEFEGWLDDVFSGIEGEDSPTCAPVTANAEATSAAPVPAAAGTDRSETLDFGELIANKPRPQLEAPEPTATPVPAPEQAATPAGDPDVNSFVDATPSDLPAWSPTAAWEPDASEAAPQPVKPTKPPSELQLSEIPDGTSQTGSSKKQLATPVTEALGYVPPAPRGNAGLLLSLPLVAAMVVGGFFVWQNFGPSPIEGLPFAPSASPAEAIPEAPSPTPIAQPAERTLSRVPATEATPEPGIAAIEAGSLDTPQDPPSEAVPSRPLPVQQPEPSPRPQRLAAQESAAPPEIAAPAIADAAPQDQKEPPAQPRYRPSSQQNSAQKSPEAAASPTPPPTTPRKVPVQQVPVQQASIEQPSVEPTVRVGTFDSDQSAAETVSTPKPAAEATAAPIERMADPFEFVRKTPVAPKPVKPTLIDGGVASMAPATLIEASRVQPRVPAAATRLGTFGEVVMQVQILADGSVGAVSIVSEPNRKTGLGKAAVAAVRQWRYRPATVNGKSAESTTEVRIRFTP